MTISFRCPNNHQLTVKDEDAGRTGKCPVAGCKAEFMVPNPEEDQEDDEGELPYVLILLWVGFGCSCVLAMAGIFLWLVVTYIALPVAIVLLILALKERDRLIEIGLLLRDEQGDPRAQYDLYCRRERKCLLPEALHFLEKAANNGYVRAQYELGRHYIKGDGVKTNPVQAVHWFQKAAEQGHVEALYALGLCYQSGAGIHKDLEQARINFQKAADKGHFKAREALDHLARQQREEEERLARQQREAEKRRAEQQRKEKYRQDILSGTISYDAEVRKIAGTMNEYQSDMKTWIDMKQRYFDSLRTDDIDDYAGRWLSNCELKSFEDCQTKLQELLEIRSDSDARILLGECEKMQEVYTTLHGAHSQLLLHIHRFY